MLSGNIQIEDWQATTHHDILADIQQDGLAARIIEHLRNESSHDGTQLIVNHDSRSSTMSANSAKRFTPLTMVALSALRSSKMT